MRNLHELALPRAASGWLWAGILVLLLAACGTLETHLPSTEPVHTANQHAYIATVDISDTDTREAIAAAYGGDVVVWRPEAGFAILGLTTPDEGIGTLGRPADGPGARPTRPMPANAAPNHDAFSAPRFDDAAALSVNAWAGGVNAWAGGVHAWAGGVNAWAGGVNNPFPGNEGAWTQMQLGEAQEATANRGQGIVIAIIDTGLDLNHVGFTGRLAPSSSWLDLVDGDTYPHEGYVTGCTLLRGKTCHQTGLVKTGNGAFFGHGTAVAGIALQAAPNATILPIRVLSSDGYGSATNVAIAIDHAIERGANVINLSLGTFQQVPAIDQMVAYAGQRGVVVVAASGNTGDLNVWYPARTAAGPGYPHAISVGSVDIADARSWFSTYGAGLVEMVAFGHGVATLYPGDAMAYGMGTSFSAPWVAGTVALILGDGGPVKRNGPGAAPLTVDTSDAIADYYYQIGLLGKGRLNALDAVNAALGK